MLITYFALIGEEYKWYTLALKASPVFMLKAYPSQSAESESSGEGVSFLHFLLTYQNRNLNPNLTPKLLSFSKPPTSQIVTLSPELHPKGNLTHEKG